MDITATFTGEGDSGITEQVPGPSAQDMSCKDEIYFFLTLKKNLGIPI